MKKNSLLDPNNSKSLNQKFREKRFAFFRSLLDRIHSNTPIEILDIGGTQSYWESMNFTENNKVNITLLNLYLTPVKYKNFSSIIGDACDLSNFGDNHFDIIFSNSVIEHLFTRENQIKMASEIRRVGKYYYIQSPNYYFPIEPHWLFPFFQFLPFRVRVILTKNFNLGHYKKSKTQEAAIQRVNEVQLLTEKEMKNLFPEGKVYREKFFGLVKSVTMYKFPEN
ncbi:MAG TPA: class I SAM-dependent methyltransferase [Chitinophagaceae bacterium]|nr:class I SAM-dependent methyltransferase [Chitinophagaceae bacterium]